MGQTLGIDRDLARKIKRMAETMIIIFIKCTVKIS